MNIYEVFLGIDRACVDTGERIKVFMVAENRLSAGIRAEQACDKLLPDPATMYSHAMGVKLLKSGKPETVAMTAAV